MFPFAVNVSRLFAGLVLVAAVSVLGVVPMRDEPNAHVHRVRLNTRMLSRHLADKV